MSHENHDHGLVHGHRWATEPSRRPLPTTIPALLNAIYHATGKRLHRIPIRPEDLAGA